MFDVHQLQNELISQHYSAVLQSTKDSCDHYSSQYDMGQSITNGKNTNDKKLIKKKLIKKPR